MPVGVGAVVPQLQSTLHAKLKGHKWSLEPILKIWAYDS